MTYIYLLFTTIKPYLEYYSKFKRFLNMMSLIFIYVLAFFMLYVYPLDKLIEINLTSIPAYIASNTFIVYFIKNILGLSINGYNAFIVIFIAILTLIVITTLIVKKSVLFIIAASTYSFLYSIYIKWTTGSTILFQYSGINIEKVLSFEEKYNIFLEWKKTNINNFNIKFEDIASLIQETNDPSVIINFLNKLVLHLNTIKEQTSVTVQEPTKLLNWFNYFFANNSSVVNTGLFIVTVLLIDYYTFGFAKKGLILLGGLFSTREDPFKAQEKLNDVVEGHVKAQDLVLKEVLEGNNISSNTIESIKASTKELIKSVDCVKNTQESMQEAIKSLHLRVCNLETSVPQIQEAIKILKNYLH